MRCGLSWVLGLACAVGTAEAQPPSQSAPPPRAWFTVSGDPGRDDADTVQVDPVALQSDADSRTMMLRVSRARARQSWEGVPYRSYEAQVRFLCQARRAEYLEIAYYTAPRWQGAVHRRVDYRANPQPMLFKDAQPNPTQRIVRAACDSRER